MKVQEVITYLDGWAPPGAAWERDNPGLQVGSPEALVRNVLICLDVTSGIVEEAVSKNCNLIIAHHPLFYRSIKQINTASDERSRIISLLIKNDINLVAYHTNLDFTKDGVSFALAEKVGLKQTDFLLNQEANQVKVVCFVPETHIEEVAKEIYRAGGGIIGEYTECGFVSRGEGMFRGNENSNPALGSQLVSEKVTEIRLEVLVYQWKLKSVLGAIKRTHPYEEPAIDVYPLKNENVNFGMGAVGIVEEEMTQENFLTHIKKSLGVKSIRHSDFGGEKIKKVAVCGGAGVELFSAALNSGADALITADVSYHQFQDAKNRILLIDAGHFETESPVLPIVRARLSAFCTTEQKDIKVFVTEQSTNFMKIN